MTKFTGSCLDAVRELSDCCCCGFIISLLVTSKYFYIFMIVRDLFSFRVSVFRFSDELTPLLMNKEEEKEEPSSSVSHQVRVAVRVRPLFESESSSDNNDDRVVETTQTQQIRVTHEGRSRTSRFARVFGEKTSQSDLFESFFASSVDSLLQGINVTVIAYGQTGSGKTFTMTGDFDDESRQGIAPRATKKLFERLEEQSSILSAKVFCSVMQIYNGRVYDMLTDEKMNRPLRVREKFGKEVFVSGLSKYRVSNTEELLSLLCRSETFRKIRSTEMNDTSSRSHAMVKIHVEITRRDATALTSALTLVDLAGSEKWNTQVSMASAQERELTHINSSLSTLSNVIRCLVERQQNQVTDTHVPFRESKLTRILQHALEGNSKTTLLATVSPTSSCFEETLSTLRFAESAGKLSTSVSTNVVLDAASRLKLAMIEIQRLKQQIRKHVNLDTQRDREIQTMKSTIGKLRNDNQMLEDEVYRWKEQVEILKKVTVTRKDIDESKGENPETFSIQRQWDHDTDQEMTVGIIHFDDEENDEGGAFTFLEKIASVDPREANALSRDYSYFARLKARREELQRQLREIESRNNNNDDDDVVVLSATATTTTRSHSAGGHVTKMIRELTKKREPEVKKQNDNEAHLTYSSQDVSSRVSVYQARLADWYEGTIIAVFDPSRSIKNRNGIPSSIGLLANGLKTCVHCVKYDNLSGYQWHDFKTRKHRVLDMTSSDELSKDLIKIRHQALSSSSSSSLLLKKQVLKDSPTTKASISAACKAYGRPRARSRKQRVKVKDREHGWQGRAGGSDYVAPDDRGGGLKK